MGKGSSNSNVKKETKEPGLSKPVKKEMKEKVPRMGVGLVKFEQCLPTHVKWLRFEFEFRVFCFFPLFGV